MEIRPLSELYLELGGGSDRRMKVCVVSSEFLGPVKNGGIGTATSALAQQLVSDGHAVTLLYTYVGYGKPIAGDKPWQHWVDELAAEGIDLARIPHRGDYRDWREASWLVKDFVEQGNFDLVYFNDHYGSGYYSMLAKRAGLVPFCDQLYCVITHGSMEWVFNINDYYACRMTDVEWMGLERRSVELADVVIAPSTYLLHEYEKYGWRLPENTFHQPYPVFRSPTDIDHSRRLPICELVFFGRLEVRKGLWLFCEALDRLAERFPRTSVTFLGRVTEFSGISSALQIVNRSARWPFRVRLLTDFDQGQALSYLRSHGKLAVMPSLADNSPCAVYECMEAGVPFVGTRGSGIDELVDQNSWDDVLVEPNVTSLTEKLAQVLDQGARLGSPRFDPVQNLATWSAWHRFVAENRTKLLETSSAGSRANPVTNRTDNNAALIVVIDSGTCTLSLLIENLSSHMKRFAGRAAFLILTSRRGELYDVLSEMFSGTPETPAAPLCILDSRTVEEARQLICASAFVFFADAETEILTSFFVTALNMLRQQRASLVSCAVAVRPNKDEPGEIQDLPTGGLPGLSALGEPIGGSAWAVAAAKLANELSSLELYDAQLDELTRSSVLSQMMLQQCRVNGVSSYVLPIVGAVQTGVHHQVRQGKKLNEARRSAMTLGIVPSVYGGSAPWFAISAFGAHLETQETAPVECSEFLPPDHPHTQMLTQSPQESDLPELAATLGRPELSLQLEAAGGPLPGRVRHLTDVATRAIRLRPAWDLADLLRGGDIFEFGLTPVPRAPDEEKKLVDTRKVIKQQPHPPGGGSDLSSAPRIAASPGPQEIGRVYVDSRRLRIRRNKIQAIASLRAGGPGKVFFFDVPLCGQSTLTANLRSSASSDPLFLRMKVIDQRVGDEMGVASARLVASKATQLSIPLHEVYGRAAIVLEFSGAEKMEVTVDSLQVQ